MANLRSLHALMLVSILARPTAHRSACARMEAAPDDLNRAFASYAGEARRGGVLWEGPEPDAAFAPDEVCVRGESVREKERERARHRELSPGVCVPGDRADAARPALQRRAC